MPQEPEMLTEEAAVADVTLSLRQAGSPQDQEVDRDRQTPDNGGRRIRCPRCEWEPSRQHMWVCACRHEWNTFDTAGVCPACQRQWLDTQCPRCHTWSPHLSWYVDEPGSPQ
jgi:hypothetical protein